MYVTYNLHRWTNVNYFSNTWRNYILHHANLPRQYYNKQLCDKCDEWWACSSTVQHRHSLQLCSNSVQPKRYLHWASARLGMAADVLEVLLRQKNNTSLLTLLAEDNLSAFSPSSHPVFRITIERSKDVATQIFSSNYPPWFWVRNQTLKPAKGIWQTIYLSWWTHGPTAFITSGLSWFLSWYCNSLKPFIC